MHLLLDYSSPSPDELNACYQAFVGHELLNHLVTVQGYARMVLEDEAERLSDDGKRMLARLADRAREADELSRRVAELGRLLREPATGPVIAVGPLLSEAAAEVKALCGRADIRYDVVATPLATPASPRLLHRALLELTLNAAQSIPAGRPGVIRLRADREAVIVTDDGPGVSEADRACLLEPFAAGRRPGATRPGLGFFLVREAARRWGTRVEVHTAVGTAVSLSLPAETR